MAAATDVNLQTGPWTDAARSGVTFRAAVPDDAAAVAPFVGKNFVDEPMGACLGATAADWTVFASIFADECCSNGTSVVGVDAHGRLACALLTRDFKSPLPDDFQERLPKYAPLLDALGTLDAVYESAHPGAGLGDSLDLWMVTVDRDGEFAGKGLATTLVTLAVNLARARGFRWCVTECTGRFSQQAVLRNGFRELSHIAYKDFVYQGTAVFASIPAPHLTFGIYERAL